MSRNYPRLACQAMAALMLLLLTPARPEAMGLGYFYATGSGDTTLRAEGQPDSPGRLDLTGSGIALDTNVGEDSTFNYRLSLGSGSYGESGSSCDSLVMVHDFGFSLARNPRGRLWIGPEVMLNSVKCDSLSGGQDLFGFGMGLSLGANLMPARSIGIVFKATYITQTLTGDMEMGGLRQDITTEDELGYFTVGILYVFGESF